MLEPVKWYIIESFREKYHRGSRNRKSEILDELQKRLGCHRKHATRLMSKRRRGRKPSPQKRGRKSKYATREFQSALHRVRKVMEFRAAEVIKLNMQEWLPYIENHYGEFSPDIREKLLTISPATMKRYFRKMREQAGSGLSTTRPGSALRTEIPIVTDSFWDDTVPGRMAADTVAHCGNSTAGQFIYSLDMVDPVTHWTAQRALWGKGHTGVLAATQEIEKTLPFQMIGLHVDNGSEFINHAYIRHYTDPHLRKRFQFTRSRAHQKNDNCYAEQKNWSVVRRYFGYDRLEHQELVELMNNLYKNELHLYLNHFCRTFKLSHKIAIKSRYRRVYGDPVTPYERVLHSEHVNDDTKQALRKKHEQLNPVTLKLEIERKLKTIFRLYKKLQRNLNPSHMHNFR